MNFKLPLTFRFCKGWAQASKYCYHFFSDILSFYLLQIEQSKEPWLKICTNRYAAIPVA